MYSLYPNITTKINQLIQKLQLSELSQDQQTAKQKRLRFYRTFAKNKNKEKVFLKTLFAKESKIKARFLNEINFYKIISQNPSLPISKFCPQVLSYSLNDKLPYIMYKFLPGSSKQSEDTLSPQNIKQIINLLKALHSTPVELFQFIYKKEPLFDYRCGVYQKRINNLMEHSSLTKNTNIKINNFIHSNQKLCYNVNNVLSHGDFSEANMIFLKKQVKIIDWEHVYLRNPFYDLADFWLKRKESPKEQKGLIREFNSQGQQENWQILFNFALVEITLKNIVFFDKVIDRLKKEGVATQSSIKRKELEKKGYFKILNKIIT